MVWVGPRQIPADAVITRHFSTGRSVRHENGAQIGTKDIDIHATDIANDVVDVLAGSGHRDAVHDCGRTASRGSVTLCDKIHKYDR
jgi:hypothetical protein